MTTTIFFSWQADTPTKEGRNLVERAFERAVNRISDDTSIEEVTREEIAVDRDTKDTPGSPPIVETIFRKIDHAAVFIPDLTFVGKRLDGRPSPNPNVLVEYGWALKSLGYSRIVPVMNTAFGEPTAESMPFDMAHLRRPITYHCPSDADDETRKQQRETLAKEFEQAIKVVLESEEFKQNSRKQARAPDFVAREPKDGPGKFRSAGEALGISEVSLLRGGNEIKLSNGPVAWFRVMPTTNPGRIWRVTELKNAATKNNFVHPIGLNWSGFNFMRSEDGFGIYVPQADPPNETISTVFTFVNGEVWAIDAFFLEAMVYHGRKVAPMLEREFQQSLAEYCDFLIRLGINPPYRWVAGMENLKGRGISDPSGHMAAYRGPVGNCLSDVVTAEGLHSPDAPPAKSLEPFFEKLFDSCGLERPLHRDS